MGAATFVYDAAVRLRLRIARTRKKSSLSLRQVSHRRLRHWRACEISLLCICAGVSSRIRARSNSGCENMFSAAVGSWRELTSARHSLQTLHPSEPSSSRAAQVPWFACALICSSSPLVSVHLALPQAVSRPQGPG